MIGISPLWATAVVALVALVLIVRRIATSSPQATRAPRPLPLSRQLILSESNTVTLAQRVRVPHDVVTLTVHLTRVAPLGQKLPPSASSAAGRQKGPK